MNETRDCSIENEVKVVAQAIRKHQCVLFLGAAIHCPPPRYSDTEYPEPIRPPMGSRLSEELAEECDLAREFPDEDTRNLQRVAFFYQRKHTRSLLISRIKTAVQTGKRPSPMLEALAGMDFPVFVTTNYDRHLETALAKWNKSFQTNCYQPDRSAPTKDFSEEPTVESPHVFKIHGDLNAPDSVVITDEDYIRFILRMGDGHPFNPLPRSTEFYLASWPLLFIGYSLRDYTLRLLFNTLRWRLDPACQKCAFSVDRSPDPVVRFTNEKSVVFITEDVWSFVPALKNELGG